MEILQVVTCLCKWEILKLLRGSSFFRCQTQSVQMLTICLQMARQVLHMPISEGTYFKVEPQLQPCQARQPG
jgi:hypothetical protein